MHRIIRVGVALDVSSWQLARKAGEHSTVPLEAIYLHAEVEQRLFQELLTFFLVVSSTRAF